MTRTMSLGNEVKYDQYGYIDSFTYTEMTIDYDAISILLPVVCPKCGRINYLSNFCPNCGERIKMEVSKDA